MSCSNCNRLQLGEKGLERERERKREREKERESERVRGQILGLMEKGNRYQA